MLLQLPPEIHCNIARFTDYDTFLNLIGISEFRQSIGQFIKVVTDVDSSDELFREFRHEKLQEVTQIHPLDIHLIFVKDLTSFSDDLLVLFAKAQGFLDVAKQGEQYYRFESVYNGLPKMKFTMRCDEIFDLVLDPRVSTPFDCSGLVLSQNLINLFVIGVRAVNPFSCLHLPNLETITFDRCSNNFLELFSKETLENLKGLEDSSSGDDYIAVENIHFKKLEEISLRFDKLRNVRFDSLKEASLYPMAQAEVTPVLENVDFPELENFNLKMDLRRIFPIMKNFKIPKVQTVSFTDTSGPCHFSFSDFVELDLVKCFKHVKNWKVYDIPEFLQFNEVSSSIESLTTTFDTVQFGADIFKNLDMSSLKKLKVVNNNDSPIVLPKFHTLPQLKYLRLALGMYKPENDISYCHELFPDIETFVLCQNHDHDGANTISKFPQFENLKRLEIENAVDIDFITGSLKNLEEISFLFILEEETVDIEYDLPSLKKLKVRGDGDEMGLAITGCPKLEELEISEVSYLILEDDIGEYLKTIKTCHLTDLCTVEANRLPVLEEFNYYSEDPPNFDIKYLNPAAKIHREGPTSK